MGSETHLSFQRNVDEQAKEAGFLQGQSRQVQRPRPRRRPAARAHPARPQTEARRQAQTQKNPRRSAQRNRRRPMKILPLSSFALAAAILAATAAAPAQAQTVQVSKDN